MSGQAETLPQNEIVAEAAPQEVAVAEVDAAQFRKILEAALLTAQEPLTLAEMKKFSDTPVENAFIEGLLEQVAQKYADSGIELTQVSSGWRFRARPEMQPHLDKLNPQKQPRYSRAVMETLAIIAYRQPVTRGDIEEIRGVAVSSHVLKTLEARGWIDVVGTRDVPGKPSLYATTKQLLDDLNLRSLQELPSLEEVGGLLEQAPPEQEHLPLLDSDPGQGSLLGHDAALDQHGSPDQGERAAA
jgi:segregation and condensation protein B